MVGGQVRSKSSGDGPFGVAVRDPPTRWHPCHVCGMSRIMETGKDRHRGDAATQSLGDLGWWRILFRYWVRDHAWVRVFVWNFYRVDEDLYRSNHPGFRALSRAKRLGIRSVLSLSGDANNTPNIIERNACNRHGMELRFVRMRTAALPPARSEE